MGQLGLGDTVDRGCSPADMGDNLPAVDLGQGAQATDITTGIVHACALLKGGAVKCWGRNNLGQLGLGDTVNRGDGLGEMGDALPAVDLGTGRTAAALGGTIHSTCAILDDATLKCWGWNGNGQLGLGDHISRGFQPGWMGDALPTVDLGTGRTAVALSNSPEGSHQCAVLNSGAVKCWGDNWVGQLGLGDYYDRGGAPGQMGDALATVKLYTAKW